MLLAKKRLESEEIDNDANLVGLLWMRREIFLRLVPGTIPVPVPGNLL